MRYTAGSNDYDEEGVFYIAASAAVAAANEMF